MLKKIIVFAIVFIISLSFFSLTTPETYGYYDSLENQNTTQIDLGEWIDDETLSPSVLSYLFQHNDPTITQNNASINISSYLESLLYYQDYYGNVLYNQVHPIYVGYTLFQAYEQVQRMKEFATHFLDFSSNGIPQFKSASTVSPINLDFNQVLNPGESVQIIQPILTAELAELTKNNPFMIQISIEAPNQEDISDFAIELIYDIEPFSYTSPFRYNYSVGTDTNISVRSVTPIYFSNNQYNYTKVDKIISGSSVSFLYRHTLLYPEVGGRWARFNQFPNYYLSVDAYGVETNLSQSYGTYAMTGLTLMGSSNGNVNELRITNFRRNPYYNGGVSSWPIGINISRGLLLDEYGNPSINQNQNEVIPIIKIRVVEGTITS